MVLISFLKKPSISLRLKDNFCKLTLLNQERICDVDVPLRPGRPEVGYARAPLSVHEVLGADRAAVQARCKLQGQGGIGRVRADDVVCKGGS